MESDNLVNNSGEEGEGSALTVTEGTQEDTTQIQDTTQVQDTTQIQDSPTSDPVAMVTDDDSGVNADCLAEAFLDEVLHGLESSKAQLSELSSNQMVLIETVQHENSKFLECSAFSQLSDTITKAKAYHTKLVTLKKEMMTLHDKSFKMKKRAVRIQQQKQKEELQRANQRERDMERERALIAKPAPHTAPHTAPPTAPPTAPQTAPPTAEKA